MREASPPTDADATAYRCGTFTILPASRLLLHGNQRIELEAKVLDLILLLVENRDHALDKQEIVNALWGHRPVTDAALSQLLYKARRALGDDGDHQSMIRTVYGRGLQWAAPVTIGTATATSDVPRPTVDTTKPAMPSRWRPRAGLAALLLAGLLAAWFIPRSFAPPVPPKPRVAILPITNNTGDASLDWTARGLPGLIASLLGDSPDLDVVDPLQVARIQNFTPPEGRSQAEHIRYVTGADTLISGELSITVGKLHQLALHVDTGQPDSSSDLIVTGSDTGSASLSAVSRLRQVLKLAPPVKPLFEDTPHDAYLAETFARGIDLATQGNWQEAKPHFTLVAQGDARFLPARFLLARAQDNTDQPHEADAGYTSLLADARRLDQPLITAWVLADQTTQAINRHEDAKALELGTQAVAAARKTGDDRLVAGSLLTLASIHARMKHIDQALEQYGQARTLIEASTLRSLQPHLHNTMSFIAAAKQDANAGITAARAELAADEALGNRRGSDIARFNLAYALLENERPMEALPLLAETWTSSGKHHDTALQLAAGNLMAGLLYDKGMYPEIRPLIDSVIQLARTHDNSFMDARMLGLRAGGEYFAGDTRAALETAREAIALAGPSPDPSDILPDLLMEAFIALSADAGSVTGTRHRVDELTSRANDPSSLLFMQRITHALAAAADNDPDGVRKSLDAAATTRGMQSDLLHQAALRIALVMRDDELAGTYLRDFNPDDPDVSADTLRLYAQWASRRNDNTARQRAETRLAGMREDTTAVLTRAGLNLDHAGSPENRPDGTHHHAMREGS